MKIAWVVPGGVDRSGRTRVIPVLLWLLERLAKRHALSVVALDQYAERCSYELLGASVHNIGRAGRARQLARAARTLIRLEPDVIHGFWAGLPALAACLAARRLACPAIATLGGGELVGLRDIGYGSARRWRSRAAVRVSLRLADCVTVASGPMDALVRRAGLVPVRLPLGIDRGVFSPPPVRAPGPPWKLLHVGSINRVKDQATLLHAFERVVRARSDVELDIVGEDTLGGELQRLADSLGIHRAVRFRGWLATPDLLPLYRQAHLFVLSSRHESGPVAALEAAACGLATVGTRVGHVADWEPDRAWVADVGDAAGLASGILTLLGDGGRRARLADAARAWAEMHDADWTAMEVERAYEAARRGHDH